MVAPSPGDDPILIRRARYATLAGAAQRIGYLLLGLAVVAFVIGFATGFPRVAVVASIAGLVGACVVLPPGIVVGYAVKAAERDDRDAGRWR